MKFCIETSAIVIDVVVVLGSVGRGLLVRISNKLIYIVFNLRIELFLLFISSHLAWLQCAKGALVMLVLDRATLLGQVELIYLHLIRGSKMMRTIIMGLSILGQEVMEILRFGES